MFTSLIIIAKIMVKLVVTDKIRDSIREFSKSQTGQPSTLCSLKVLSLGALTDDQIGSLKFVDHKDLLTISHHLKERYSSRIGNYTLRDLVRGSEVYIPPKPIPPPKSKKFLEQMEQLRKKAQEDEYKALLGKDVDLYHGDYEHMTPGQEVKVVREQLSTIINILISVASVAWALWFWTGSSGYSDAARTLICVLGGLLVLVADVVVYLGYQNKIETAKEVEQKKVEKKVVISSTVFENNNKPIKLKSGFSGRDESISELRYRSKVETEK